MYLIGLVSGKSFLEICQYCEGSMQDCFSQARKSCQEGVW